MSTAPYSDLSDEKKVAIIRKEVAAASKDLMKRHPWLRHQNAIGFGIFSLSVAMIAVGVFGYFKYDISAWLIVPWQAFWMSILHELEHDNIHYMYFKKNKPVADLMLLVGWLLRPTTINPWFRRHLHFHHHRLSGTRSDIEERALTNGEKWSFLRLIKIPDLILGGILRYHTIRKDIRDMYRNGEMSLEEVKRLKRFNSLGFLPFGLLIHFIWYFFVIHYTIHGVSALFDLGYQSPAWIQSQMVWVNPLVALLIGPNMLRQLCLHFITSNMHYYGDVEPGNIMQQTQVLNPWWLLPFQLFCFNFGSTHAIHHFVVNETFYVRQLTAGRAHKIMREVGVRFNDLGTFSRANKYHFSEEPALA